MKTILFRALFAIVLVVFTACVNPPTHQSGHLAARSRSKMDDNQKFRINMHFELDANGNPLIVGSDVVKWQSFLKDHHFGLTGDNTDHAPGDMSERYPTGEFDKETEDATKRFQASIKKAMDVGDYQIGVTGSMNWATYLKATDKNLKNPMYPYPTDPAIDAGPKAYHKRQNALTAGDNLHTPLQLGCIDWSTTGTIDKDVTDWQGYLVYMGYMSATTGTFGSTTQMATKQFQIDFTVNAGTGILDSPTFTKAENNGMTKYTNFGGGCRTH